MNYNKQQNEKEISKTGQIAGLIAIIGSIVIRVVVEIVNLI
jgi:hypothetical protein